MKLYLLLILLALLPFLAEFETSAASETKRTAPPSPEPESVVPLVLPTAANRLSPAGVQPITSLSPQTTESTAPSAKSCPAP